MELSEYTIEQLQAELNRRKREERQRKIQDGQKVPKYEYVRAVVKHVYNQNRPFCIWYWDVEVCDEDCERLNLNVRNNTLKLKGGVFNKDSSPKEGDTVILQERITASKPTFTFSNKHCKISEIVID